MILVTGSTGLVGAHLLYQLVSNNEKVKAIYRDEHKLENVKNVFSTYTDNYKSIFENIDWVKADILKVLITYIIAQLLFRLNPINIIF